MLNNTSDGGLGCFKRKAVLALLASLMGIWVAPSASAANAPAAPLTPSKLSSAQIVDRNIAARGGAAAWRGVQTLSVSGTLDAGAGDSIARSTTLAQSGFGASARRKQAQAAGASAAGSGQVQLPFRLELKRPHFSRLEIDFAGKTAIQVFDGEQGWKFRPYLNRDDVEAFTAEEVKASKGMSDLEGPLVDSAAKGSAVAVEGMEPVEGHDAYRLKVTAKDGHVQHVWVDAQSFLDVKLEGIPRVMDGTLRSVWVYQRDFRSVQGVMVPFLYETAVDGGMQHHKMTVQNVVVNPPLDASRFSKPQVLVAETAPAGAPSAPAGVKTSPAAPAKK
jgi:outer membrane lipoprotein-sorting protein